MSNTYVESAMCMPLGASAVLSAIAENRWMTLVRGIVAIAFGLIAFFHPGLTLTVLIS